MAINKNHEFEDLDGIKCAIVEKNITEERVSFLKKILEYNRYDVVVIASPIAKPAIAKPCVEISLHPALSATPNTYTMGVTDVTFNPVNAIFGRSLKMPNGDFVRMAYWQQKEMVSNDETLY